MTDPKWIYKTGGIPDEMFARDEVPMTKAEVRAVTLAKARLQENHVIWDIGAGTGSISIEAALITLSGQVFAVEKKPEAVQLIKKNIEIFSTGNITVCSGVAPEALQGLPKPDRVFIGGSGGNLAEIIRYVHEKMPIGGRVVVNAIVLESLVTSVETMKKYGFGDIDVTQVSIAKTVDVGRLHMFKSHNPVFIISSEKTTDQLTVED